MSPNAGDGWGGGGGGCGVLANKYNFAHGALINFGDLTSYLSNDSTYSTILAGAKFHSF
jgi:hypothetical protein